MLRRYSVPISITVHATALAAVILVPLVEGHALPAPATQLIFAAPASRQPREPPPPLRAAAPADTPRPDPRVAPVEAPPDVSTEPTTPPPMWPATGIAGGLPATGAGGVAIAAPPPAEPAPAPAAASAVVRVGGRIREPHKIKDAAAVYPPIALAARVSGTVVLDAVIGEDGRVRDVTVRTSVPLLNNAAIDAVRQWAFTPTTLNGVAVPVILTVRVTFTLQRQ